MLKFLKKNYVLILIIVVFLIAAFLRLWKIDSIPFGLNNDSAWEISAALDILNGNASRYLPYAAEGWRGEGIIRLIIAGIISVIGNKPVAVPLSSVFFGIGLIVTSFLLIRKLFNEKLALLTSFFIAISGWHITFSKTGWRAITVPFFTTLIFYFLFKGFETKKSIFFIFSGIFLGLVSFYTYDGARAVPLFFLFWLLIEFLTRKKFIRNYGKNVLFLFISAFIISLPMLTYAFNNFENFKSRSDFLFIGHRIEESKSLTPLVNNISISLQIFNVRANGNDFFIFEPLVDRPVSFLIPIGLLIAIFFVVFKKNKKYFFILSWLIAGLSPGILSIPNGNRDIGTIPPVYFLAACGLFFPITYLVKMNKKVKNINYYAFIVIIIFCSYSFLLTYKDYLGPQRRELPGFYPETLVTTNYIKKIWNKNDIYLTDNYPRELLTYYLYLPGSDPFAKNYTWLESNSMFLNVAKDKNKGIAFFMFASPENEIIANQLLNKYSKSKKFYIWYQNDNIQRPASLVVKVEP